MSDAAYRAVKLRRASAAKYAYSPMLGGIGPPHAEPKAAAGGIAAQPAQRKETSAMETSGVQNLPPAPPVTPDATESPVPEAQASSAEVLITEQQVMFSTAVAAASRPENRLLAAPARGVARRMYYLECARMGREMDRL
jgi:hypothetical protein